MKGAEAFTTNMESGSISSLSAGMQWNENGNYTGFDNEANNNVFINAMVGEGAMRGYFSSMIQTGIGSTMNFEGEFKSLTKTPYIFILNSSLFGFVISLQEQG